MLNGSLNGMRNGWTDPSADEESSSRCITDACESTPSNADSVTTFASNLNLPAAEERRSEHDVDSWRDEVSARLERYRTRRKPRTPRYPSLLLPFDAPESWSRPTPASPAPLSTSQAPRDFAFETNLARNPETCPQTRDASTAVESDPSAARFQDSPRPSPEQSQESPSNLIEFPRSAAIPIFRPSDLADPVFDLTRPRIVEAPEILPPPPALGGMLIEPSPQELAAKQAHLIAAFPSTSASIRQRALAGLLDGAILAASLGAFGAIFLRLNPSLQPSLNPSLAALRASLPLLAGATAAIALLFWAAYQFFFVVYTGSTPGLRVTRLRLAAFDGSPLSRSARRWRVFASFLSAFSAGLGYLWCLLDPHGLCWHDRITRTHIQPAGPEK
jgi:uncharacterized RDD family membrane protein YckC